MSRNPVVPPPYDEPTQLSYMPAYTSTATGRERMLQSPASSTDREWVYKTDHMCINLGPRLWGSHTPSYGLNGKVEGSITFTGAQNHVERVTAVLAGKITSTTTHRGTISGQSTHVLLSQTVPIYPSQLKNLRWEQAHTFSISFPDPIHGEVGTSQLPSSFSTRFFNVHCDVAYTLKLDMVRKGFRRHESRTIPILYLPKTVPPEHPVFSIPRPLGNAADFPVYSTDRVKTVQLAALSPKGGSLPSNDPLNSTQAMYLSLPSPACFASGDSIPFNLTMVFTNTPALAPFLAPHVRLKLIKRARVWTNGRRDIHVRHSHIANWGPQHYNDSTEGVIIMKGAIRAGTAGRECSWKVDGVAEVQAGYLIVVTMVPPKELLGTCPSFNHEEVVQITTDPYGALERELMATGGLPTPALALAPDLRHLTGTTFL